MANMSKEYVASVDQGTTSTRVILFDPEGNPVCVYNLVHETTRSRSGWEEHNPMEILNNVKKCIDECLDLASSQHSISVSQVKAIGITNQRETTVVWDRTTGTPLYNAIVWQDNRTHSTCEMLRARPGADQVTRRTGLRISTYFSGVKLRWLIDNEEAVANAVANGTALFGTIDTWLVWNLAQGNPHVTDVTNAGRTMLMNINSLEWDDHMLDFIGVTRDILPEIRSSSEMFGTMSCTKLKGVPISGLIGDQQAALVGQSCFNVGEAKSTYGTGGFLIVNTGLEAKFSRSGLLTTPAYKLGPDAPCVYSLEGSIGVAGSAVTWLRDGVGMISSARETEEIASSVTDTGNVYVVPAFTGLFAPWWREDARGTIVGMTQFTTRAHIVRAVLEAITFKVNTVLGAATEDMGHPIAELKVDGGVSNNNLAMQMQADITNTRVVRPRVTETTALGAAFCAGHVVGLYQSMDHFREAWELDREFTSQITQEMRQHKLNMWNKAVQKSLGWGDDEEENVGETSLFPAANLVTRHLLTGLAMGIAMTCAGLTVAQRLSRK